MTWSYYMVKKFINFKQIWILIKKKNQVIISNSNCGYFSLFYICLSLKKKTQSWQLQQNS